jgi:iron complex outermembrane receptor protein
MPTPNLKLSPFALAAMLMAGAAAHAQTAPASPATDNADGKVQTVVISASADASAGGLPKDYAGGQVAAVAVWACWATWT